MRFSSPAGGHAETETIALDYIYQQLVTQGKEASLSCVELVNLEDDMLVHRLTEAPLPRLEHDTYLSLFREVVQHLSGDIVIEAWDKSFTYSQLDATSTAFANVLRSLLGVKRGETVFIALEWSSWAPVCVLGIFKAGAAFFFIDPQETTEKIDWHISQANARLILCDSGHQQRLFASLAQVVAVQSFPLHNQTASLESQPPEASGVDLAYIVFTSGSTGGIGGPKTVLVSQQALAAGVAHQGRIMGMSERSRVLGGGPLHFAGSKLVLSLAVGACLCIPQPSQGAVEAANRLRTDFLLLPAGAGYHIDPTRFTTRQAICIGAEVVPQSMAALWGRHHSLRVVWGATEMIGRTCGRPWEIATSSRDIGHSAAHRFWIVDPADHNRLMPLGWPGEVLVQSIALASGYLGNEAATANAFPGRPAWYPSTISAFAEACDAPVRWYKTGDMGQLDPVTLTLTLIGRIDALQLALPGGRIDVTALEARVQGVAGISDDVVVQLGTPRGERTPRVIAFLAKRDRAAPPEVRISGSGVVQDDTLRRRLWKACTRGGRVGPEYVVVVQSLPGLPTGKIWRLLFREWVEMHTLEQLAPWQLQASDEHGHTAGVRSIINPSCL